MNTVHASITREKYKTTIVTDNKHTLVADEPITAGGENLGMTPGQLLASSIISCTAITLRMYADRKEWPLEKIDISITYEKKEDKTVFYKKLTFHGNLDDKQRERLLAIGKRCPIERIVTSEVEVVSSLND
ncbi:MAG: OsmC family protein [Mesonia hippocampi]|uniref:OsmC family protein n=1 Tax=Mesonia hippocampi TaxID=1628250 RepID=UPI003F9658A1